MGLTFDLSDHSKNNEYIDSLYDSFPSKHIRLDEYTLSDAKFIEQTPNFNFYHSPSFQNAVLSGVNRTFYITGTKGIAKRYIKDVVISAANTCSDGLVICRFNEVDSTVGEPLFCSSKIYDLQRTTNQTIAKEADKIFQDDFKELETAFTALGKVGNLHFLYADDFKWKLKIMPKCVFPRRAIVKWVDGKLVIHWAADLDLFGIQCF